MATRSLDSFAPVFQRVTEHAAALLAAKGGTLHPKEPILRIPCDNEGQAINVQMQLRQYWQALARAELPAVDPRLGLVAIANELACRAMHKNKHVVEVVHRSQLGVATLITSAMEALDRAVLSPLPPPKAAAAPASQSAQDALLADEGLAPEPAGGKS